MVRPKPGETVFLLCLNCHHSFLGPCPEISVFPFFMAPVIKKSKCPKCGRKKVVMDPWVRY
jgi:hypothetical protein